MIDSQTILVITFSESIQPQIFQSTSWLVHILADSEIVLTGLFADKKTHGQSSCGLVNSLTSQLTDGEFLKITELLRYTCTLNLALSLILTLSTMTVYKLYNLPKITPKAIIYFKV